MLLIYIVSTIVAGVLILLSVFGADHDHDTDTDHDLSIEGSADVWLPFFSLRFYTYFFAGFGSTGLLISLLTKTPALLTGILAAGVGLVCGLMISYMMRLLRRSETTTSAKDKDVLGKEATVLVTIRGNSPGRIRCSVKGDIIDFLAIADHETPIEPGSKVVVVAMENGRAQVVLTQTIFDEEVLPQRTS